MNPAASNLDEELRRFDYKVEAGAEFVLTRPIFDVGGFERVPEAHRGRAAARSSPASFRSRASRNAEFMANEVPGVRVPDALMERMRRADGSDAAAAEGIAIAREIAGGAPAGGAGRAGFDTRRATSTRPWRSLMDFANDSGV